MIFVETNVRVPSTLERTNKPTGVFVVRLGVDGKEDLCYSNTMTVGSVLLAVVHEIYRQHQIRILQPPTNVLWHFKWDVQDMACSRRQTMPGKSEVCGVMDTRIRPWFVARAQVRGGDDQRMLSKRVALTNRIQCLL